ncbi:unnamed protein product [Heligmosomoides polygyrus]|uniref:Transposase n=1 Tax=Heligmosomoides polygyrus TaxID=6339 RepID=A0A183G045_HELPZ|nr:unnamed protein product [Heligmosomoides polygyrus]
MRFGQATTNRTDGLVVVLKDQIQLSGATRNQLHGHRWDTKAVESDVNGIYEGGRPSSQGGNSESAKTCARTFARSARHCVEDMHQQMPDVLRAFTLPCGYYKGFSLEAVEVLMGTIASAPLTGDSSP